MLEHPLWQTDVVAEVARRAQRYALLGGETGQFCADRPKIVYVLVGVQMAGPHGFVQTALPLRLDLLTDRIARLRRKPKGVLREAQVKFSCGRAELPESLDRLGQRLAMGEVYMKADAPVQFMGMNQLAGLVKGWGVGHQGGRADQALAKGSDDHLVVRSRQTKIVGIDDHSGWHNRFSVNQQEGCLTALRPTRVVACRLRHARSAGLTSSHRR